MTQSCIEPYLFFGGRCEEAITFYQETLGASLEMLMRYDESPAPHPPGMLPDGFEKKVMHASLMIGSSRVMASDGCGDEKFGGFSLSFVCPSAEEAHRVFSALADGGAVKMPLMQTFWSPCFGMLEDQFGLGWMITVNECALAAE